MHTYQTWAYSNIIDTNPYYNNRRSVRGSLPTCWLVIQGVVSPSQWGRGCVKQFSDI